MIEYVGGLADPDFLTKQSFVHIIRQDSGEIDPDFS